MDSTSILRLLPDGNGVLRRVRSGEGRRSHDRVPQLDYGCKGEGEVDPTFYSGPQERRCPHRLKVFLQSPFDDLVYDSR